MSNTPPFITPAPPRGGGGSSSAGIGRRGSIGTSLQPPQPQTTTATTTTSASGAPVGAGGGTRRSGAGGSLSAGRERGASVASSSSAGTATTTSQHHTRVQSREFGAMPTSNYVFPTTFLPTTEDEDEDIEEVPQVAQKTATRAATTKPVTSLRQEQPKPFAPLATNQVHHHQHRHRHHSVAASEPTAAAVATTTTATPSVAKQQPGGGAGGGRRRRAGVTLEQYHLPDELDDSATFAASSGLISDGSTSLNLVHDIDDLHSSSSSSSSSAVGSVYSIDETDVVAAFNQQQQQPSKHHHHHRHHHHRQQQQQQQQQQQEQKVSPGTTTPAVATTAPPPHPPSQQRHDPLNPRPIVAYNSHTTSAGVAVVGRHQTKRAPVPQAVAPLPEEELSSTTNTTNNNEKPLSKDATLAHIEEEEEEDDDKNATTTRSTTSEDNHQQQRHRRGGGAKPMVEFIDIPDDDEVAAEDEENNKEAANFQPLWPEFSPKLAASIHAGTMRSFEELFATPTIVEPPQHTPRHHEGHKPSQAEIEELDDEEFEKMIEEEIEEMIEAAPVKSQTHAAARAASSSSKPVYYFQKKQVLDKDAGTLEGAAPAVVSAAVRANQSPFSPFTEFHQDLVSRANPEFPEEITKLLEDAVATPADVGSVMATPLGYNAAWRMTGVMLHPITNNIVLNPAVVVPGSVITRADAAKKMDAFKAIMIRGMPVFERGVQTTLTAYHETSMFFTACRNALLQQEQIVRMGMTSERAFAMIHMTGLEQYYRDVTRWNSIHVIKERPKNILAQYLAGIRERKGQRMMLEKLLEVPTSNGVPLREVLEPEQTREFDRAIRIADQLIETHTVCSLPLLELVKSEESARRQEVRCYEGWASSMEHLESLIRMSFANRSSTKVQESLRTTTELDREIEEARVALSEGSKR